MHLISEYYSTKLSQRIYIEVENAPPVDYFPPSDLNFLDSDWCCGVLFSLLTLNDFFKLISAIMTEQSVVFVSKNLGFLTSCILGI